jgi:DNA modification methylase
MNEKVILGDCFENLSTIENLVKGLIKTTKERFHFKDYFI